MIGRSGTQSSVSGPLRKALLQTWCIITDPCLQNGCFGEKFENLFNTFSLLSKLFLDTLSEHGSHEQLAGSCAVSQVQAPRDSSGFSLYGALVMVIIINNILSPSDTSWRKGWQHVWIFFLLHPPCKNRLTFFCKP